MAVARGRISGGAYWPALPLRGPQHGEAAPPEGGVERAQMRPHLCGHQPSLHSIRPCSDIRARFMKGGGTCVCVFERVNIGWFVVESSVGCFFAL